MKTTKYFLLLLSLLVCLAGCGGGGGGTNPPPGPVTGILMDAAVGGVDYACTDGASGTTNAAGEFTCTVGDTVTFTLAGYTLGEAPVSTMVTVFDITGATQPTQRQLAGFINGQMNNVSDLPVHRALNTAMLLQTLDDDGDPSNGINITPATAQALSATSYKLNLEKKSTAVLARLRKILQQAGLARNPRSRINTVRHLVQTGVVTTLLYRITDELRETANEAYHYTWDDNGDGTLLEEDLGANGSIEITTTNTYHANHNVNVQEIDNPVGDAVEYISVHTYDTDGNVTREDIDFTDNATADLIYTYDYDAFGNQTLYQIDTDASGAADEAYTSTYDGDGNLIRYEEDYNLADSDVDFICTYTYDSDGNELTEKRDLDADTTIDETYISIYDADGNLTSYRADKDGNGDGTIDYIIVDIYNVDGNLTSTETDFDASSNPGIDIFSDVYTYDARGNRQSQVHTSAGVAWTITYFYDSDDNRIGSEFNNDSDTTTDIDRRRSWFYDTHGNKTRFEYDTDADGTPNAIITYTYEATTVYPDTSNFPAP